MKILSLLIPAALIFTTIPAHAEIFRWHDAETKLSLSYPDNWRPVSNQQPDDIFTVAAPGDQNAAGCRMRVREDRRFLVYPRSYADEIQRTNYSRDFWEKYGHEFNGHVIYNVADGQALGSTFASQADISFKTYDKDAPQKRGTVFAGVYNDKAFILECSAAEDAFPQYREAFLGVLKSIEMRNEYATRAHGWYRPFTADHEVLIHGAKPGDLYAF